MSGDDLAVSVDRRVGFHFTHTTHVASPSTSQCQSLTLTYTLPPGLFADPYELEAFHDTYSYELDVNPDLELPISAVDHRDTTLRLTVAARTLNDPSVSVSVPLHARYGRPALNSGSVYSEVALPAPNAVWTCLGTDGKSQKHSSAGSSETVFFTPVGRHQDVELVEVGTAVSLLFASAYLSYTFMKTFRRLHSTEESKLR